MNDPEDKNLTQMEVDQTAKTNRRFTAQISDLQKKLSDYSEDKSWIQAWKERLQRFFSLKVGTNSAASAFYLIFSLFPLLMFIFSLLELLDPGLSFRFGSAIPDLDAVIPDVVLRILQNFLDAVGRSSSVPLLSLTALGLLWAASRGVGSIVASLNRIYHAESRYNFLLRRLLGIIAIFASSFLLLLILLILAFNRLVINYLKELITLPAFMLQSEFDIFANLAALLMLTFIFTVIFSLLKRQRSFFRHTVFASVLTALGWIVISYGLSFFISNQSNYYLMYGSITGIIFLMLWLYLALYILMIGAFIHAELIRKYPRSARGRKTEKNHN